MDMESKLLENEIFNVCKQYTNEYQSKIVAKLITRAERKGVSTHGLHYFLHSVLPLIKEGRTQQPKIQIEDNFIYSEGEKCIGLVTAYECIKNASKILCNKF